jgi:hypothetical protein
VGFCRATRLWAGKSPPRVEGERAVRWGVKEVADGVARGGSLSFSSRSWGGVLSFCSLDPCLREHILVTACNWQCIYAAREQVKQAQGFRSGE